MGPTIPRPGLFAIKYAHGVVRGRTIELTKDPGVADGQVVEITINAVPSPGTCGEGLRRCAGAFAADWTDEVDLTFEEIYRERKRDTREVRRGACPVAPGGHLGQPAGLADCFSCPRP